MRLIAMAAQQVAAAGLLQRPALLSRERTRTAAAFRAADIRSSHRRQGILVSAGAQMLVTPVYVRGGPHAAAPHAAAPLFLQ